MLIRLLTDIIYYGMQARNQVEPVLSMQYPSFVVNVFELEVNIRLPSRSLMQLRRLREFF
jgi:hypothetical protein